MARYPSLFIYVLCFLGAFYETAHPISASLFDTPTARHNIISYSLPRVGLRSDEDCNLSIYHAEFERDMAVIKAMGVNAVHLLCPWATTDLADHTEILKTLVQYNMSFIVSLRTDIYQIEQRGGEKAFQDGMYVLADEIAANPDAAKLLKALSIQYNLTGETASYFFQFVNKVKFWMNLLGFDVPLLVPWVNDISLEDKDIETQLTQWNSANFDAWMTHLYTPGEIQNYVNRLGSATILKQVFIVYGWDSYNTLKNKENQTEQAINVQTLYVFISQKITDSNNTVLGSSVYSFADIYHGAEDDKYVYGDPSATCPDVNPWIQTSCGRRTSDPVNSTWGEDAVSVEVMGLFEHYETIYLTRCVKPKLAALAIASLFTGNNSVQINEECITAISNPFIPYSLLAPAGVSVVGVFISLIFCCVRPESTRQKPTPKTESDLLTKLQ